MNEICPIVKEIYILMLNYSSYDAGCDAERLLEVLITTYKIKL
jgi:hypothetical protein